MFLDIKLLPLIALDMFKLFQYKGFRYWQYIKPGKKRKQKR